MPPSSETSAPEARGPVDGRTSGDSAASLDAFFLCESVRGPGNAIIDFRILGVNDPAAALAGVPRADLVGRAICDLFPSVRETGLLDHLIRVVETGESFEDDLMLEEDSGEVRWVRDLAVRVGDGLAVVARDITRRKLAEREEAEGETRFHQLVENASDAIYRFDTHGVFLYANRTAARLMGRGPDEPDIVGRMYLEFVRRDYHDQGIALYKRQVAERIPVTYWEFPVVTADGRELWIGQNVHIEQRHGAVTSLFAVARDITERKIAEIALRESEERYRFLTDHATDMLCRQTPSGVILDASPISFSILGYAPADLVGRSVFEFCHPDDLEPIRAAMARLAGHQHTETMTFRARRRDGQYVWLETTSQGVRDPATGLIGEVLSVSRDITERRRLEEELRRTQKMDAVGQLAGGVAHDFNNLLTAIRGFADLIARSLDPGDSRRRDIAEIFRATERAASLTRQLLALGKRQVLRIEPLDLNVVVNDMLKTIRRLLGEGIRVEEVLEPGIWTVRADPGQLEQVLLNLSLNARDAMPHGGVLRIATRNVEVPPVSTPEAVLPAGRYVAIEVRDTGVGMTEGTRARLFEPFFTTKDPDVRSGLGLATVYGIVTQSGGHISVASAPGEGATFTIHLPAAAEEAEVRSTPPQPTARSDAGNRILLAEDNEGVRALAVRILETGGYRVIECPDGLAALETLRRSAEPVDLLLTDVMMPRMNGPELAANFRRVQPGTPVLFISGFMDNEAVRRVFASSDAVLSKPFTPDALLARVAELIGAPKA